ncbi:MAG: cellulase family glycosylhydrolase, partial [Methanobrevibacter sp.]|uniref:cellulase family glycosylhydrolase n=1 Tax=Methanobrevibacter sp. TaxID=66852 RepID=UPI003EFED551
VKAADPTGNTMFSIHMYSVAGKDASTVKNNIDSMLGKGVCTAIGEFGDFQNGGDVDEATIISYSEEKKMGTIAWSWKGNGGQDMSLDMSNDWEGTDLTQWGKYAFYAPSGIYNTSKLAYSLKKPDGSVDVPVNPDQPDTPDIPTIDSGNAVVPDVNVKTGIKPGFLGDLEDWYVSPKGDDSVSTVSKLTPLIDGGYRVSFDLGEEPYPYLVNMSKPSDLSGANKISVIIRNNAVTAIQLQPIVKVGDEWEWTEYDRYKEIPALTTVQLDFDLSKCPNKDEVNAFLFRIQGAGSKVAGSVDFLNVSCDLPEATYKNTIAELNRPKTAAYFTWAYPEASWKDQTTSTSCSKDGVLSIDFKNVTSENAAGIQTETKPGLGKGIDCSAYKTLTCKITNKNSYDVSASLLIRTSSNWTWQENPGVVNGVEGGVIPAGKTVEVTYNLQDPVWKSKLSNWEYTGTFQDPDDARAIGFKIWANEGSPVDGSLEISDFAFNFK